MSLPQSTTVLIVGAGPVGVTTALSLVHYGIRDIALVDSVLLGENSSRAHVLHAATLESLSKVNAADGILARSLKVEDVHLGTRTTELVHASFSLLKGRTAYPYSFLMPQSVTEQILTDQLRSCGIHIYRPCTVVGLRQNAKDNRVTDVLFEDGQTVSAQYVIGADGVRSTVRSAAGIGFTNPNGDANECRVTQMILADFTLSHEPDMKGLFNGIMSSYSWCVVFNWTDQFNEEFSRVGSKPIHGNAYRIVCGVPERLGTPPAVLSREYIQSILDIHGPTFLSSDPNENPNPIHVDHVIWSARFRTHSAIADRMFTRLGNAEGGVILLVGDAAHIHPPAGGQGMNLGLRDAVFLGEALSKHIYMSASASPMNDDRASVDEVLQAFAHARHARALGTIQFTRNYLQFVSMPYSTRWWMPISFGWLRDLFVRFFGRFTILQMKVAVGLSGLARV